jgi:hypothetical protein
MVVFLTCTRVFGVAPSGVIDVRALHVQNCRPSELNSAINDPVVIVVHVLWLWNDRSRHEQLG